MYYICPVFKPKLIMKKTLALLCMCISITCNYAQKVITGRWEGKLQAGNVSLRIVFHFNQQSNGSYSCLMDSPDQGATGIHCDKVTMHGDSVTVQVMSVNGRYDGLLINDSVIKGDWEQAGEKIPVMLKKGEEVVHNIDSNCVETKITLETKTGKIYGTLCTPKKYDKIPVALIIAGSGPTDRDGNSMGLQSDAYKILAHKLGDNNIATVRYDKRGIGESKDTAIQEKDMRFENYINDASDWIAMLRKDKRFSEVIIIGHSEGSLIGIIAAQKGVDKYVSIAGIGESADKTLKRQLSDKLPKMGKDTAYRIIDSLAAGKTVSHIDMTLYALFRPSIQPYLISMFKYDPAAEIKKLTIPVLILQGTKDLQVKVEDAKMLKAADASARLELLEGMNHTLRKVGDNKDANMKSYEDPTMPIDEELVTDIVEFIKEK